MDQNERVQIPQECGSKIYEMSGRRKYIGGYSKSKIGDTQQINNLVQNYGGSMCSYYDGVSTILYFYERSREMSLEFGVF